jgi:hypothetical protein
MAQNYENHAHRPVLTGVGYLFVMVALISFVYRWRGIGGRASFAIGLLATLGAIVTLLLISRRYITKLQDRIIKLEMRMRGASLLTAEQQKLMLALSNKQIAALRFASDAELPALLERAARESMAPKDIKRAVKVWVPDLDRT